MVLSKMRLGSFLNKRFIVFMFMIYTFVNFVFYYKYNKVKLQDLFIRGKNSNSTFEQKNIESVTPQKNIDLNRSIKTRLKSRLFSIQESCRHFNYSKNFDLNTLSKNEWPWMYVSLNHRFLYCQSPKVGSTNWLLTLNLINEKRTFNASESIHYFPILLLSQLNESDPDNAIKNYRKFMVIRDPFERILSAYQSKFTPYKNYSIPLFTYLSKKIVQNYRSPESLNENKYPTFEEFVEFVTDTSDKKRKIKMHYSEPRHWIPQVELCFPCRIDYDFILDMKDHLDEDSYYMFSAIGISSDVRYPKIENTHYDNYTKGRKLSQEKLNYFLQLNPKLLNALYDYYRKDYRVFGVDSLFQILSNIQTKA